MCGGLGLTYYLPECVFDLHTNVQTCSAPKIIIILIGRRAKIKSIIIILNGMAHHKHFEEIFIYCITTIAYLLFSYSI